MCFGVKREQARERRSLRVKDGLKSRAARERGLRDKGGCEGTGTEERASGQASERERESTSEQTNKQADVARAVWRRGREGQKASAEDEEREGERERPFLLRSLSPLLSSPVLRSRRGHARAFSFFRCFRCCCCCSLRRIFAHRRNIFLPSCTGARYLCLDQSID